MSHSGNSVSQLSLAPLGAGDLIDRAVRFYRRNFGTFLLIAAPPVIVGTLFSLAWTLFGRQVFSPASSDPTEQSFYFIFTWFGSIVIWCVETIATLVVMGGASRNFVRHLLFGEKMSFTETYRYTRSRIASLITASTIITFVLGVFGVIFFYIAVIVSTIAVFLVIAVLNPIPLLATLVSVVLVCAVLLGMLWLFFLIASRLAYVPQVILVEGQGVFQAIGRSASLAGKNVRRLMALFVFTTVATYSALAILFVPLGWYAWANGVSLVSIDADVLPAWYEVANNLVWQISFILLSPVWTVGLCLLYVDERVRTEGYDIELMAARRLGDIPAVPQKYNNPLQPALGSTTNNVSSPSARSHSMLGLE